MLDVNGINLPTDISDEDCLDIIEQSRADPEWFVREVLGGDPWEKQVEIMEAIRDNKEVAVKSCHSAGKDWICGRIVPWFLYSFDPSLVITTAPTDRQVRAILWKEISLAYNRANVDLGGTLLKQELRLDDERTAFGFTTSDDPERFAGFHRLYVLVILDEASGISAPIYEAISGVLSSEHSYKLEIGNPNNPNSPFAQSFKTPGVKKISITAFDTPNFTTFGITLDDMVDGIWREKIGGRPLPRPELVTPEWVARRLERWGKNNPLFRARALAEFPEAGENNLIPLALIEAAQNRELDPDVPDRLGVDVARFGDDHSVIARRRGPVVRIVDRFGKVATTETTGKVAAIYRDTKAIPYVDEIGVGAGVVDMLRDQKIPVVACNAASSPVEKERFLNARAEWFWNIREAAEKGELDLDPDDEELAAQLADIRYKYNRHGKIQIEEKDEMKKRQGASPDDADAVAHTFSGQSDFIDKYNKAMQNI